MKNITLLLFVVVSTTINAQYNFNEDFESFSTGDYLGETSPEWTTWSGTTGGTEDVQITSENASSGTNSTFYSSTDATGGPQDVVLPFEDQPFSSGDFIFSANFFVNPNTGAYFNLQAEVEIGQTWAIDCNMNDDGTIILYSSTSEVGYISSTYPEGEWFNLRLEVDLTINIWTLFINDENLGSFTNAENEIASLDIFPLTGNQFYVDDINVSHVPALLTSLDIPSYTQSPTDVEIAGTVFNYGTEIMTSFDVIWTDGTDSYTSNFTGLNIASMDSYDFVCTDLLAMPNPSLENLTVTIENVNGSTDFDGINNSIDHTIESFEFVTKKIPLYEHFTSNTCGPCATFNSGFQELLDANNVNDLNDPNANAIKFQANYPGAPDQSYNDDVAQRLTYYAVTGIPTAHIDGSETGSSQTNLDTRLAIPSFLDISGTAVATDGTDVEVNVSITSYFDYENTKLHISVVENEYYNNLGSNGETEFFQVNRKMLPSAAGTSVDLSSGSSIQASESATFVTGDVVAGSYNLWEGLSNCLVVVYVQNDVTKEVYQSKTIEITGNTTLAIDEQDNIDFQILPNPANDKVEFNFKTIDKAAKITIYSITGQVVSELEINKSAGQQTIPLDVSGLNPGIYSVTMQMENNKTVRQLVKK